VVHACFDRRGTPGMPTAAAAAEFVQILNELSKPYNDSHPPLAPNADFAALKSRWRALCLKLHPDKGGDAELFRTLKAGWEKFSDSADEPAGEQSYWDSHDSADEDGDGPLPSAKDTKISRTQLITFSHSDLISRKKPKDFSKETFKDAVLNAYRKALPNVSLLYCCVFRELHHRTGKWELVPEEDLAHFHLGLNANTPHRWKGVAEVLRSEGIYCHFSDKKDKNAGYASCVAYGFLPSLKKKRAELDPDPLFVSLDSKHPDLEILLKRTFKVQVATASHPPEDHASKKKVTPRILCYQAVVDNKFTDEHQLKEFAAKKHAQGIDVYLDFLFPLNSRDFIENVWEFENAKIRVRRKAMGGLKMIENLAAGSECVCLPPHCWCKCVCPTDKLWYTKMLEVLQKNPNVDIQQFCEVHLQSIEKGPRKFGNPMIVGDSHRAKSFWAGPAEKYFHTFAKPQFGEKCSICPLAGILGKEFVSFQDLRVDKDFLRFVKWEDLLVWLEGKTFNISLPKTNAKEDAPFTCVIGVWFTGPHEITHPSGDRVEQKMMDNRMVYFEFKYEFEKNKDSVAEPCPHCWANLLLDGAKGKHGGANKQGHAGCRPCNAPHVSSWEVSDVVDFVRSTFSLSEDRDNLGELFKKHEIDGQALLALTENDLKGMGIQKIGVVKKLMAAIATAAK